MIKQFLLWEMEVQPQLLLMLQMTYEAAVMKKSKNPNLKSYRAQSITDNMSVISATTNDSDYKNIFLRSD